MALLHGNRAYVAKSSSQDWVTKLRWMPPFSKLAEIVSVRADHEVDRQDGSVAYEETEDLQQ